MLIGFVGDVHGRVFHMLAALATWQEQSGKHFDAIFQVGDMGAYPRAETMDHATRVYVALDSAEGDFARFLQEDEQVADQLQGLRKEFRAPIHFIHGNHDDVRWLKSLLGTQLWIDIDRLHFLRYVEDGSVIDFNEVRVGFLGGGERPGRNGDLDDAAYDRLMTLTNERVDVLLTHDAPYGIATGRDGRVQGSPRISTLLSALRPRLHVFGHYHHLHGPRKTGRTVSLGLSSLVASARWDPDATGLQPGCIAVLDTDTGLVSPVTDSWLVKFPTPFRFKNWCARRS